MTWIYHDHSLFNLSSMCHISRVGDFDISLMDKVDPDSENYFVLSYSEEDQRDQAFEEIRRVLFARSI